MITITANLTLDEVNRLADLLRDEADRLAIIERRASDAYNEAKPKLTHDEIGPFTGTKVTRANDEAAQRRIALWREVDEARTEKGRLDDLRGKLGMLA
jgi:hypothetical protein